MKLKHENLKILKCGVYLDIIVPIIGATSDRIMTCDYCTPECVDINCQYPINYTSAEVDNISLSRTRKHLTEDISISHNV